MEGLAGTLDLIIDTIPKKHDLDMYLELLAYNGTLWILVHLQTYVTTWVL